MTYRIEETTVLDKASLLWPLLEAHRDELATHKDIMPLAPNMDVYAALEYSGALLSLIAYLDDAIAGYSLGMVTRHMHYDLVYYHNDVLFVDPIYRNSRVGVQLIQETERRAKARGAAFVTWHAKPNTPMEKLLDRKGYGVQDIMFSKRI